MQDPATNFYDTQKDFVVKRRLIKIKNVLSQETAFKTNTPLFYIYDDGTVEKVIIIE